MLGGRASGSFVVARGSRGCKTDVDDQKANIDDDVSTYCYVLHDSQSRQGCQMFALLDIGHIIYNDELYLHFARPSLRNH
jgi:hypothetical protein